MALDLASSDLSYFNILLSLSSSLPMTLDLASIDLRSLFLSIYLNPASIDLSTTISASQKYSPLFLLLS